MSLKELNIGKRGRIVKIDANREMKNRLNGMGIIKNIYIKTLHSGRGIKLYEVLGTQVALRNEDAGKIYII